MKLRRFLLPILACSASLPAAAQGTNQYWNIGGSGGDGIWGTGPGEKNWNLTAGAASGNTTWANTGSEIAVFQDTLGGTVTLFDSINAAGISQNGSNYTLSAGDIVLANPGPTLPAVHVNTGTLTIQSTLAGTAGFQKTGPGTLALESFNTNTGPLQIGAGNLLLNGSLANTTVTIDSGATLTNASGGLATTANLTNSGTLTMGAADTIGSLVLNGGTVEGPGILTTATTTLNGGTVAGKINGDTTSTGDVLVSGTLGGGLLDITGGTLNLTGTSTNTPITIATGATLIDTNGGLDPAANLTNSGIFTVNSAETIVSYIQNSSGSLDGTSSLTSSSGATLNGGTVAGSLLGNATSTGVTLVSGTLGGGFLNITGGTLNLTGASTNTPVTIGALATLIDANGGLADTAAITNAGVFTVNAADTIGTYTQSSTGSLTGAGILTTTGGATLNGGTISGKLNGNTISTGDVLVSGTLDAGSLDVRGGTLTLTGKTYQRPISISPSARLLVEGSGLAFAPAITNDGILTVNGGNNILSYIQNGAGSLDGAGTLDARSGSILNGGTVAGNLRGNTTTTGDVLVSGTLGVSLLGPFGGSGLHVNAGTLNLTGTADTVPVTIARGATLIDANGGLNSWAMLINDGALTVNAAETILSYRSNSGALTGVGSLTTRSASLQPDSLVSLSLKTDTLITDGNVAINSSVTARDIQVNSGILTNIGSLVSSSMNIEASATLVASGSQQYNLLTTFGPGTGIWQGDLNNPTTVAPGGVGGIGTLRVTGNFTNAPTGTLNLDLGTGLKDLVTVGGKATFGGALALNQLSPLTPFVPVQVVAAGTYAGTFATLTENLDGTAWFNPSNGTVTTLSTPAPGDTLWGGTSNQSSAWLSLYDDVVEPGTTNVLPNPAGGYSLTSGPANAGNPDLLNALTWSTTPGGLNAAVLDRLSPEVYIGLQDYAIEATRAHQRTAMETPSLGFIRPAPSPHARSTKDALPATPATDTWEYFAALDYFDAATDSSPNQADYGLSGLGVVTGVRSTVSDTLRIGGYVAINEGSLDGSLIDGDADGWSLGVFARKLIHARTHTLITGGMSYGKYQFDGTRDSLIATAGRWTPANSAFSGVDSDSLEFYLGASALAFSNERFRLIPAAMLRYASGGMNGFAETAGGPGSPVPLRVGKDSYQNAIAELSLRAEADLTNTLTAHGLLGFSVAIRDHDSALSATFTPGGRPFRASAAGLDGDAFFLGLGAEWSVRENLGLGIHWRADFRADAETENQVGLSTSFRF